MAKRDDHISLRFLRFERRASGLAIERRRLVKFMWLTASSLFINWAGKLLPVVFEYGSQHFLSSASQGGDTLWHLFRINRRYDR